VILSLQAREGEGKRRLKITGSRFGTPGTGVELDPTQELASGLNRICYASCNNVLTRDQSMVGTVIGYLSDAVMRQIEACLKTVLEIP
jgi:mRNA-degrading endonuclease toxin of MazEF toxin-antitoxin module